MFTPITGRSVLVTGGTKGIGKGIAQRLRERRRERGHHRARRGGRRGGGARPRGARRDGLVRRGRRHLERRLRGASSQTAVERNGGLDVLCANAGIFPMQRLTDMTEADIDEIFGTNVKGCMLSVRAALPALRQSGRGRVILTSSITGPLSGYPGWSHYGATKSAQLGFLKSAAVELAPMQITMNAVLPGNVVTEGLDELGEDYRQKMEASIPQGRLGSVEDIGNACLFFASDEASYITGQALAIDGGQMLPESLMALEAM